MIDLYLEKIETPIGSLIAIANNESLIILQTEQQLLNNKSFFNIEFKNKSCDIIKNLRDELRLYFNGSLKGVDSYTLNKKVNKNKSSQ